jgi:hypothetical protein
MTNSMSYEKIIDIVSKRYSRQSLLPEGLCGSGAAGMNGKSCSRGIGDGKGPTLALAR